MREVRPARILRSLLVQVHVAGRLVRESTKQGNDKVARQMKSAHRTSLAKGEVGIREQQVIPTLKEFCSDRVEPWAKARFEATCWKN